MFVAGELNNRRHSETSPGAPVQKRSAGAFDSEFTVRSGSPGQGLLCELTAAWVPRLTTVVKDGEQHVLRAVRSVFSDEKKLSIAASFQTLPGRLIEQITQWPARARRGQ
jgi:hypothetical protein